MRPTIIVCVFAVIAGCSYRLAPIVALPPQQLRIVASRPNQFTVTTAAKSYEVPPDGRVTVDIPPTRQDCGPYFLGLRMSRRPSPADTKIIDFVENGRVVRSLSANEFFALPKDSKSYWTIELGK